MPYELWTNPLKGKDVISQTRSQLVDQLDKEHKYLAKNTIGKVVKAWLEGGLIDDAGAVWIDIKYLGQALRTNQVIANMHRMNARECDLVKYDSKWYMNASLVLYHLNESVLRNKGKKRSYIKLSEDLIRDLRESSLAVERQTVFWDHMYDTRKGLKKQRIKEFKISADELTGQPLEPTSEFSHIMCAAYYFKYSDKVWNGLIVNKSVHTIITAKKITDDAQLLNLCREKGWNNNWHPSFEKFRKLSES